MIDKEIKTSDYDKKNEDKIEFDEISDLDSLTAKLELYSRKTEDILADHLSYLCKNKNIVGYSLLFYIWFQN